MKYVETFGGDLFSRSVTTQVSSALARLTSVFEMGTGGATPLEPPKDCRIITRSMKIINLCQNEFYDKVDEAVIGNSHMSNYVFGG